jgi:hypothetical protein
LTWLSERLSVLKLIDLKAVEYNFSLDVPRGISFYSAHFKLDLLGAFGRGVFGDLVALVDVDTLLLDEITVPDGLAVYDISDQVFPAYGQELIRQELERIAGRPLANPRWYGGEFLMGRQSDFARLMEFVRLCWPRYIQQYSSLHHQGDEMPLSAAINLYAEAGSAVCDFGARGSVARWWSGMTRHRQETFSAISGASLLHLPADKAFLGSLTDQEVTDRYALIEKYRASIRLKLLARVVLQKLRLRGRRESRFAPRLS